MNNVEELILRLEGHIKAHEELFIQIQEENEELKRVIKELYTFIKERRVI